MKRLLIFAALLLLSACCIGCAEVPQELVDEARAKGTKEQVAALDEELEKQANKFALFRSYTPTTSIASAILHGDDVPPTSERALAGYGVYEFKLADGTQCVLVFSTGVACVPKPEPCPGATTTPTKRPWDDDPGCTVDSFGEKVCG